MLFVHILSQCWLNQLERKKNRLISSWDFDGILEKKRRSRWQNCSLKSSCPKWNVHRENFVGVEHVSVKNEKKKENKIARFWHLLAADDKKKPDILNLRITAAASVFVKKVLHHTKTPNELNVHPNEWWLRIAQATKEQTIYRATSLRRLY